MKNLTLTSTAIIAAAGIAATVMAGPQQARAEVSFEGKEITMIIGYRPGGGTDATGRLLGEYLAKSMPGSPQIIFRNMPGGGGITAMNYFARQAAEDGSTITMGSSTQPDPSRFRRESAKYDPLKFLYIGGVVRGATVLMIGKDAKARLTDKSAQPVVMGAVDGTRSGIQMALWGREYLDWNLKWVIGYPGTSELALALQRNEIDMTSTANIFFIKELQEAGQHEVLVQSGTLTEGKLVAREEFPDAPLFPPMVRTELKSDLARQAFDYWEGINSLDKWLALPGGVKADIVKTYRDAFRKAVKDPEFLERGKKTISKDFTAIMPEDQQEIIRKVASTSDKAIAFVNEMRKKQGLPETK